MNPWFRLMLEDKDAWLESSAVSGVCGELEVVRRGKRACLLRFDGGRCNAAFREWMERRRSKRAARREGPDNGKLVFLAKDGQSIGAHFVGLLTPLYALGLEDDGSFLECVVVSDPPGHGSHVSFDMLGLWARWRQEAPELYAWRSLGFHQRRAWLHMVRLQHVYGRPQRETVSQGRYELDGALTTDYPSFFIALGEALCGPREYYGGDLDALHDCLCGGFGPVPPFTLVWHNSDIARAHLNRQAWKREHLTRLESTEEVEGILQGFCEGASLFEAILELFEERKVSVELSP